MSEDLREIAVIVANETALMRRKDKTITEKTRADPLRFCIILIKYYFF